MICGLATRKTFLQTMVVYTGAPYNYLPTNIGGFSVILEFPRIRMDMMVTVK